MTPEEELIELQLQNALLRAELKVAVNKLRCRIACRRDREKLGNFCDN